jgi:hypothetical protein
MALSLLVLLVPIFVLLAAYRFVGGESPVVVDPSSAYADARAANAFPVAEVPPPKGWQVASAAFRRNGGGVLRIGLRGPDGAAVQVIEGGADVGFVPSELGDARPEGVAGIGGRNWVRHVTARGERALVLSQPDRTVIVLGSGVDAVAARISP